MAACAFDGTIGRAVADYTGRKLLELEAVADPNAPAFAVRALLGGRPGDSRLIVGGPVEVFFLIRVPLQHVTASELEECEFTQWPPAVRQ